MDTAGEWAVLSRLKRAMLKKLSFLLALHKWRFCSLLNSHLKRRPSTSFNDRTLGLHGICIKNDEQTNYSNNENRALERTRSYGYEDDDIDRRAEIFIANFRRQLVMERQVSLQLRYSGGGNSFN